MRWRATSALPYRVGGSKERGGRGRGRCRSHRQLVHRRGAAAVPVGGSGGAPVHYQSTGWMVSGLGGSGGSTKSIASVLDLELKGSSSLQACPPLQTGTTQYHAEKARGGQGESLVPPSTRVSLPRERGVEEVSAALGVLRVVPGPN